MLDKIKIWHVVIFFVVPFFSLMVLQNVTQALFDLRLLHSVQPKECHFIAFKDSIFGPTIVVRVLETRELVEVTLPMRKGYSLDKNGLQLLYIDPQFPRWSNLGALMVEDFIHTGIFLFVGLFYLFAIWRQKRRDGRTAPVDRP